MLLTLDRSREIGYLLVRRPYEKGALSVEVTESNPCREKVTVSYRSLVKAEGSFDFGGKRIYNFVKSLNGVSLQ